MYVYLLNIRGRHGRVVLQLHVPMQSVPML